MNFNFPFYQENIHLIIHKTLPLSINNVSCHGASDGEISVSVIGTPVPPFTYSWNGGSPVAINKLLNIPAGNMF